MQELYGAERTSTITAALSRLFTAFLQRFGFTCGMSDVFLVRELTLFLENPDIRNNQFSTGCERTLCASIDIERHAVLRLYRVPCSVAAAPLLCPC